MEHNGTQRYSQAQTNPAPLLTINQAAAHLGVSRTQLYRFIRRGDLPVVRVGERLRVRPEDIAEYLEARRV
jgi:excisionase family DNA binding protein